MKIKNRIITRYSFVSIKTVQRVIINNLSEFKYFSTKKVMPDMSKKGSLRNTFKNAINNKHGEILYDYSYARSLEACWLQVGPGYVTGSYEINVKR